MSEIKVVATNKRAYHDYFISDNIEAGIVLCGSEVKSVRANHMSIAESFVQITDGEVYLKNAYIKNFEKAGNYAPDEKQNRKLLLHNIEIRKLEKKIKEKGFTIIPLKVYFKDGLVKVEIGLAKGKKQYDKKQVLMEKQVDREMQRTIKNIKKIQ